MLSSCASNKLHRCSTKHARAYQVSKQSDSLAGQQEDTRSNACGADHATLPTCVVAWVTACCWRRTAVLAVLAAALLVLARLLVALGCRIPLVLCKTTQGTGNYFSC
jgi:hypothetical protein